MRARRWLALSMPIAKVEPTKYPYSPPIGPIEINDQVFATQMSAKMQMRVARVALTASPKFKRDCDAAKRNRLTSIVGLSARTDDTITGNKSTGGAWAQSSEKVMTGYDTTELGYNLDEKLSV